MTDSAPPTSHRERRRSSRHAIPLPTTFGEAVRFEFRRAFHFPFDTPIVIVINAALMSGCWFLLPPILKDNIFTFHGSLDFPVVLCAWMYSDVPTTNVLGADAVRMAKALGDPTMVRRMLLAKSTVLWLLITPFCLFVGLYTLIHDHHPFAFLFMSVWIAIVPWGFLGISGWLGIRFPYHPMPVRYRLSHLHPQFRMLWRWMALLLLPYVLVPMLGIAVMAPSALLWGVASQQALANDIPIHFRALGVGVACVVALMAGSIGLRGSLAMIARRETTLRSVLSDPTWG
jgi:hypothetical protein